jgi:hypothetical protein
VSEWSVRPGSHEIDRMAEESKISTVLNHLAWLREQLGSEVNRGNAHAGALLTYNAAAMLQWHFVFPSTDQDRIPALPDRKRVARLIDDFVWNVRGLYLEAKALRDSGKQGGKASGAVIGGLVKQIAKLLRGIPKFTNIPEPSPVRCVELEQGIEPGNLLQSPGRGRRASDTSTAGTSTAGSEPAPLEGFLAALAGTLYVQQNHQTGHLAKDFLDGSAEMASAVLKHSLAEYTATLTGKSAERLGALGGDILAHLTDREAG